MQGAGSGTEEIARAGRRESRAYALALDAAGIRYVIRPTADGFAILVATADAARARAEIDDYMRENEAPQPAAVYRPSRTDHGWAGVFGYTAALTVMGVLQYRGIVAGAWFTAGRTDAELIRQGELWRAVTALSLHVDAAHLLANLVIGSLVGLFAGQMVGSGLAWISILAAGAAGNALNALIRHAGHTSVGASTAVFAALGIVSAYGWASPERSRRSKFARIAPIVGGVVLLSYLGTGGERTDVLAHVAGFFCGLIPGAIYGRLGDRLHMGRTAQVMLGVGAAGLLIGAWVLAITQGTRG